MKRELKDAFRLYDREGQGFISTDTLRGLISELLAPLTDEEVEGILEELDEDGSGSMDFDEFCEMMTTGRSNYHIQKKRSAKVGKFNWSAKAKRRASPGTGRSRHVKKVNQRFANGFRHAVASKACM